MPRHKSKAGRQSIKSGSSERKLQRIADKMGVPYKETHIRDDPKKADLMSRVMHGITSSDVVIDERGFPHTISVSFRNQMDRYYSIQIIGRRR